LPEATEARLTIYDALGRVLYTAKAQFEKGYNLFNIERKLLGGTGSLYYRVETDDQSATMQMLESK
jgi:hypothetical protein